MIGAAESPASTNYGVVPAFVTQNNDALGRVKVRFPWMDSRSESDWLPVVAAGAGPDRGFYTMPRADDLVLVAFAFGQVDQGYVIGGLWSSVDKPPGAGDPNKQTIKSFSGHTITLDDTKDAEQIAIIDKSGQSKIVFDASANTITIESGGDLTIKATGALALHSDGDLAITGKTVTISADDRLAAKSNEIAINGASGVKINDGALEVV